MSKYRLIEVQHPLHVTKWVIEKRGWFGWCEYNAHWGFSEGATFYNKDEAIAEYNFLIGKTTITEKQILP
jgi:hypothetical protein